MQLARESTTPIPQTDLLGMPIAKLAANELLDHVLDALSHGRGGWIITANLNKLQRYVTDASTA